VAGCLVGDLVCNWSQDQAVSRVFVGVGTLVTKSGAIAGDRLWKGATKESRSEASSDD
jgi:hypothetical protein